MSDMYITISYYHANSHEYSHKFFTIQTFYSQTAHPKAGRQTRNNIRSVHSDYFIDGHIDRHPQHVGYNRDIGNPQDLGYPQDVGYPQDIGHSQDPDHQQDIGQQQDLSPSHHNLTLACNLAETKSVEMLGRGDVSQECNPRTRDNLEMQSSAALSPPSQRPSQTLVTQTRPLQSGPGATSGLFIHTEFLVLVNNFGDLFDDEDFR